MIERSRLKRYAVTAGLGLYVAISLIYIAATQYSVFRERVVAAAVLQGRTDTIQEIIARAEKKCEPFSVFLGDKIVNLVNVECFRKQKAAGPNPAPPK